MFTTIKKKLSSFYLFFWIFVALNFIFTLVALHYFDNFILILNPDATKTNHNYLYAFLIQFALITATVNSFFQASFKKFNKLNADKSVPKVIREIVQYFIWALGAFICYVILSNLNFNTILATSGGLGIGTFYIFRERVADFTSGLFLQVGGLVSNGDWIYISNRDFSGRFQVIDIDQKYVTLKFLDDSLIRRIPNNVFFHFSFFNYTKQEDSNLDRRKISIELRAENDSDKVLSVIKTTLDYVSSTNKDFSNKYDFGVSNFDDGYVVYQIRYVCKVDISMRSSETYLMSALKKFLGAASIDMSSSLVQIPINQEILNNTTRLINVYKLSILKALSRDEIISLSKKINTIYTAPKEHLIKKGEIADSMYIISEGSLEVSIINNEGKSIIVATLWPGQNVGEMSLLTGAPRSADVYSRSDATLLEIKKEDLSPILKNNPQLIDKISDDLAEKLAQNSKMANQKEQDTNNADASKGIASKILKFFFK
jgi:CRP-like cAMP-binding protein